MKIKGRKITSLFVVMAMLLAMLPTFGAPLLAAPANGTDTRVADTATMNDWTKWFGSSVMSTENAGGVWTDKSVLTSADAFAGTGITMDGTDNESFLVALSAIASSSSVTGRSSVPTDTMLVLDVSGSMNDNQGNNDAVEDLVNAANASIAKLLEADDTNRVGVVLYSGTSSSTNGNANAAVVLLPLGRYTATNNAYLLYSTSGDDEYVATGTTLREEGKTQVFTSTSKEVVGATYIQKGIQLAMEQFLASSNTATGRMPIMILMSDGAPTLASSNFTSPGTYDDDDYWADGGFDLGNGSSTSAAQGFVTQLTAAYAKAKIEEKYGDDLLFYTLGFKVNTNTTAGQIAQSVLDPENSIQGIDDFWAQYNAAAVGGSVKLLETGYYEGWGWNREWVELIVSAEKIATPLTQDYVTGSYTATSNLTAVFDEIVGEALLQARFFPTLIKGDEDLSGYISFVDKIGHYMEVTDVKGILIHNTLFSGAEVASHIVDNVGNLNGATDTSTFNAEFVAAVMARLGITDPVIARTLIKNAVRDGQIHYTNANDYSNYIGWYANAAGQYLGYWHEGSTTVPETTGNVDTDPVYYVKSYGYLGEVDAEHGVSDTDMMYTTVQVRENIKTGDVIVTFAVPAALIPVVTYDVTLDENEELIDLQVSGAQHPIRLVYEVALKDGIDEYTIHDANVVDQAYVAANTNATTGEVYFYTNQYEVDNTTGYGKDNTYSYFNPAKENSRYYYTEPSHVYTDENGTLYTGTAKPDENGVYYRAFAVYEKSGSTLTAKTAYERISADSLKKATYHAVEGHWDIPAGTVHTYTGGYTVPKTTNATGTLPWRDVPFVDVTGHEVNEEGYYYYVGATLGNNGRVSVMPTTGLAITKTVENSTEDLAFTFVITGTAADANQSYPARYVAADGTAVATTVTFGADSKAVVTVNNGEGLFVSGMTAGRTYTITENDVVDYIVGSVNGDATQKSATITLVEDDIIKAEFVNVPRGEGTLTVAKVVHHNLGEDYVIPSTKTFTMTVTLNGVGTASTAFAAKLSDAAGVVTDTMVTTNASGVFTVSLKAGEQLEIDGLPIGTTATVVENTPGSGFTEAYYDNGQPGDGVVTVDGMNSVIVVNTYTPNVVYPVNLVVGGTKHFVNEDGTDATWGSAQFTVILQRREGDSWMNVESIVLDSAHPSFTFDMTNEVFGAPGVYAYQIIEELPEEGSRLPGVLYDREIHTFSVTVTDTDMDGALEITRVHSEHANKDFGLVGGSYKVDVSFTNTQYNTTPAESTIDVQKLMTNASGSPIAVLNGFEFGLYTDANCTTEAVVGNGITAIHNALTDVIGEGRISITFDETGTYIFYVKEKAGSIPNMTYSDKVVRVAVKVTAGLNGRLTAITTYNTVLNTDGELEFTNVYEPDEATLVIDTVSKVLNGRDMTAGEFSFAIIPYGETTPVATGTNAAAKNGEAAKVTFAPALTFDKVGEYYFNIAETSTDGNGVTVQKAPFRIVVTVTDVNGKLTATYTVVNHAGNDMVFTNTYTATPATYTVRGNKTLVGKALINDEFTFVLAEADAAGKLVSGGKTYTTTNFTDGHFVFETLTFDKAGTYYYVVSEKQESTGLGIAYDSTTYVVAITVTDDGLGTLTASATVDGSTTKAIVFTNTYVAKPVSLTVDGGKTMVGKILNGGDYEFELYAADATWTTGSLLEAVKNDINGDFLFTKFGKLDTATNTYVFDKTGDYYYVIKEKNGGKDIDGVLYDKTEYRILVEVTDDLKGYLHTTVHFYDQSGIPQSGVSFENEYRVTSGSTVTLEGTKEITGREMTANDVFTFNLFEADASFTVGSKLQAVKNSGKNFKFEIAYEADDVGKTFYYVVKEDKAGETENGLTNATTTYNVTVTVVDDGDGTMTATANIANGPIRFVNTYKATAATHTVTANKTLTGKTLKDDEFTFVMAESDAESNLVANGKSYEAKNKANGTITFETLTFDAVGTYYYVVSEKAGAANVGITYDGATYLVAVTVTDDGLGTLTATATVDGSATKTIGFVNAYAATSTNVTIPGDKVLTGKVLNGADYEFELYASDATWAQGVLLETVENDVNGDFTFTKIGTLDTVNNVYAFTEAGDYYYLISEKNGGEDIDGVLYDATVYRVHVKITDDLLGALHKEVKFYDVTGAEKTEVSFQNEYRITSGTTITLEGTKVIDGREMTAEDIFQFKLSQVDSLTAHIAMTSSTQIVQNDGENFKFELTYDADDAGKTFYYIVTEVGAGETENGLTNSTTFYEVTVEVKDNGDGTITATADITNGPIRFVNTYEAEEVGVEITADKDLVGKELEDGEFAFLLYETDDTFAIADTAAPMTALNGADGTIVFDELVFDEVGTYYYLFKEDATVDAEDVAFDESVYQIVVTVTDDGKGALVATKEITKVGATGTVNEIVFTNVFTPEIPEEPDTPDIPQTGVSSNLLLMIALMFVSGGILGATVRGKKKQADN
ncbi:MAG: hypothetical protein J6K62_02280 [Clostridia bacterium]|nr:hypothetical protein [Clostridia bacterium]